jgi:hypothetical protein
VGSTNRRADAELIEELRRFARGEGFDEQPMPGLDSEALSLKALLEHVAMGGTYSSRAVPGRPCVATCCASVRSTPSCASPPASSTLKA